MVVRKETLHKYNNMGQKSDLKIWILVTSIDWEVSMRCWALNFDKYSYRGDIEETEAFSIDSPAIERCWAICPQLLRGVE